MTNAFNMLNVCTNSCSNDKELKIADKSKKNKLKLLTRIGRENLKDRVMIGT